MDKEDRTLHAYDSPHWWYDIRGYFILRLSYHTSLFSLLSFFNKNIGKKHLESAIGSGTFFQYVLYLRKWKKLRLPETIEAFDYSDVMLMGAKKRFGKHPNISIKQCDVLKLPYESNSFDTTNVANAIHCFHEIDHALQELFRVTKPGGTMAANILLYPSGNKLSRWIANKINNWGMKKGILFTPYKKEDFRKKITATGYMVISEAISGNSYHIIARKPLEIESDPKPSNSSTHFDFNTAFQRNIGWFTNEEQALLKNKRIAIAGLGGVGGVYMLTLSRLGIGNFNIADLDRFELSNFNRQAGATLSSINQPKVDVLKKMGWDINPELNIKSFSQGINHENIDDFLDGVDLYVDGMDFFELDKRALIFDRCNELGIPAVISAPVGMGASYQVFMPGGMTFNDFFCFDNLDYHDKLINFIIGLNPTLSNTRYLVKRDAVDLVNQHVPSTIIGCQLCSGVTGAQAIKILLNRGKIYPAPYYHLFEPYLNKYKIGWLPFGNKNPIQKLKFYYLKKYLNLKK